MMKVLFLDIDGVLNRQIPDVSLLGDEERQKPDGQNEEIEEDKMALLSRLVRETGAVVVLHSGWRFRFDENGNPLHPAAKKLCSLILPPGKNRRTLVPALFRGAEEQGWKKRKPASEETGDESYQQRRDDRSFPDAVKTMGKDQGEGGGDDSQRHVKGNFC